MPVSRQILRQFSLLRPLDEDALERLSNAMVLQEFPRRAVLTEKGTAAKSMGFLVSGRLQGVDFTIDGRSVGLYFVNPGDFYNELSIVDGQDNAEHIVAANNATVATLDAQSARRLIHEHPDLSRAVMERLASRVRQVTAQRTLLSLPNPFQRLCVLIGQMAQPTSTSAAPGTSMVPLVPTHQEFAMMINSSRETVTRAFQVLFAHEILTREGEDLRILDAVRLRRLADGKAEPPR